jgi:Uri superfamily endonuclease
VTRAPQVNCLYVVAAWVPRRETIVVGALGPVRFERGWHAYVGSARRGRDARVARHMRAGKPTRWHADYLFSRHPATRAWLIDTPLTECELVELLLCGERGGGAGGEARAAPGFGSSDCRCGGHLLRASPAFMRGIERAMVDVWRRDRYVVPRTGPPGRVRVAGPQPSGT